MTIDGSPHPHAEIYLRIRLGFLAWWDVEIADGTGRLELDLGEVLGLVERVAAWHPDYGMSRVAEASIGARVRLVLDRPLQVASGRCLTRGGLPTGRIAIEADAHELEAEERPRIDDAADWMWEDWAECGYVPLFVHKDSRVELDEALVHGFTDRVILTDEHGSFRCCGLRDAAPALRARVEPRFEKGPDEESFVALDPRAIESSDSVPTWRLPYERVRWEVVAPEKTLPDDQGTWAARGAMDDGPVWIGYGERQELWTRERELRLFYARRPWTYVVASIDMEPSSAEILRFEAVPKERLARVALHTSAKHFWVDVLYPVGDEEVSMRDRGGMLRLRAGEVIWVYPAPGHLDLRLDPMDSENHGCFAAERWLDVDLRINPSPGQKLVIDVPEREGARVRLDLRKLREPERRLPLLRINGKQVYWLYVDGEGRVREYFADIAGPATVFSCELFPLGLAVIDHWDEPWRLEVMLVPGMNDVRIE